LVKPIVYSGIVQESFRIRQLEYNIFQPLEGNDEYIPKKIVSGIKRK